MAAKYEVLGRRMERKGGKIMRVYSGQKGNEIRVQRVMTHLSGGATVILVTDDRGAGFDLRFDSAKELKAFADLLHSLEKSWGAGKTALDKLSALR